MYINKTNTKMYINKPQRDKRNANKQMRHLYVEV